MSKLGKIVLREYLEPDEECFILQELMIGQSRDQPRRSSQNDHSVYFRNTQNSESLFGENLPDSIERWALASAGATSDHDLVDWVLGVGSGPVVFDWAVEVQLICILLLASDLAVERLQYFIAEALFLKSIVNNIANHSSSSQRCGHSCLILANWIYDISHALLLRASNKLRSGREVYWLAQG